MALTERSRSAIDYQGLSGVIRDEEAVGEMLSLLHTPPCSASSSASPVSPGPERT